MVSLALPRNESAAGSGIGARFQRLLRHAQTPQSVCRRHHTGNHSGDDALSRSGSDGVAHWRERLAGLAGLRVGLCWAGGRSSNPERIAENRRRSITLDMLAPLGDISGVRFISLQKGPPADEATHPPQGMELYDFTDDLHDFAYTAALIKCLDLVISVDTSVAHLAGGLGKPV